MTIPVATAKDAEMTTTTSANGPATAIQAQVIQIDPEIAVPSQTTFESSSQPTGPTTYTTYTEPGPNGTTRTVTTRTYTVPATTGGTPTTTTTVYPTTVQYTAQGQPYHTTAPPGQPYTTTGATAYPAGTPIQMSPEEQVRMQQQINANIQQSRDRQRCLIGGSVGLTVGLCILIFLVPIIISIVVWRQQESQWNSWN